MRKIILSVLCLLSLAFSGVAVAQPYTLANIGRDSLGIEVGGSEFVFGKGLLASEFSLRNTHDAPESWGAESIGKSYNYAPEVGFLVKTGYTITPLNLTVWAGAGASWQNKVDIGITGASDKFHKYIQGAGGLMYRWNRALIQVGYNNRRGVVGGLGVTW